MRTTHLVPRAWREELVLALRDRDVSGRDIGDALAHVESFCLDSGQSADEAFGPAHEYAASLRLPSGSPTPTPWPTLPPRELAGYTAGMLAVMLLGVSAGAWAAGGHLELGAVHLVLALMMLATFALLVRHAGTFVRWCVTRRWVAWAVIQAPVWAGAGLAFLAHRLLPDPAVSLPAAPVTLAAAAALVIPSAVAQLRHVPNGADVLAAPLEPEPVVRRRERRASTLVTWALPICGAVAAATTLGLGLLVD